MAGFKAELMKKRLQLISQIRTVYAKKPPAGPRFDETETVYGGKIGIIGPPDGSGGWLFGDPDK